MIYIEIYSIAYGCYNDMGTLLPHCFVVLV
uniref:Uncharacterized protein n=1 Tax=virus sp. ctDJ83 TaxID=2827625 RepID=A0A8S5RJ16_9VIRU|nr:MAG TPA: hypothetical protein [virus sp. ctDJ83]